MKLIKEWVEIIETAIGEVNEDQEPILWLRLYRCQAFDPGAGTQFITRTKDVETLTAAQPALQGMADAYFAREDVRLLRRDCLEQPAREDLTHALLDGTAQIYAGKVIQPGTLPVIDGPDEELLAAAAVEIDPTQIIELQVPITLAWAIIGALQLALRHEHYQKKNNARRVRHFVEQVGGQIATTPALKELFRRGSEKEGTI